MTKNKFNDIIKSSKIHNFKNFKNFFKEISMKNFFVLCSIFCLVFVLFGQNSCYEMGKQILSENDSDNDQIPDPIDNCPATSNANQLDLDQDGVGAVCENFVFTCWCNRANCDIWLNFVGITIREETSAVINERYEDELCDGKSHTIDINGIDMKDPNNELWYNNAYCGQKDSDFCLDEITCEIGKQPAELMPVEDNYGYNLHFVDIAKYCPAQ